MTTPPPAARRLLPRPRSLEPLPGRLAAGALGRVQAGPGVPDGLERRARERVAEGGAGELRLALDAGVAGPAEGYELRIDADRAALRARDAAGLRHGLATLAQWLALHAGEAEGAPCVRIRDWPDFPVRGVMLDVSRDKVPTLATLRALVDLLAAWKVNQLQLYFEHVFAYPGHEVVWKDASPYTPDDVRTLDAYCAERGIELVPNQNSLGHLHRWLVHEPYRELAECPDGVEHPFGFEREPFSLCPTDERSLAFLAELFDALLPCFRSRSFNVGLDETFDVGQGRSAAACHAAGEDGAGRVYIEFLRRVHRLVRERGRRMQFWGDVVLRYPDLIPELPRDAIALEWGYEAPHPFAEHGARFAASGLEFWVCPGTSSWNSLVGRVPNMLGNLRAAAKQGLAAGARGWLVTDWGDHGHLQPLPVSYPGLAVAAALAWNADDAERDWERELPGLLDTHVFGGAPLGRALCELGGAYRETGVDVANAAAFHLLLHHSGERLPHPRLAGLSEGGLQKARQALRAATGRLPDPATLRGEPARAARELGWAASLADLASELGLARLAAGGVPAEDLAAPAQGLLGERLRLLVAKHEELWLARNRPGGLADSRGRLERVLRRLAPSPLGGA